MKYLILILALASCTTAPTVETPIPVDVEVNYATPQPPAIKYYADWPEAWTAIATRAIDELAPGLQATVPGDYKSYIGAGCPIKQLYVGILSRLAHYESGYNAKSRYVENFKDSKGNLVVSGGILQLSVGDAGIYGCEFHSEADLYDPERNIRCAVRIVNKWVTADKVISGGGPGAWKGMARYWSPFRDATKRADIQQKTLEGCEKWKK